ncbi:MAG: hypothetical protein KDK23_13190 [Leptospiraceae bacterium]|nr:hypothetical protein [Leptospiraceae bacterium]
MKLALKKKTLTYIFILVSLLVTAGIWVIISITRDVPQATAGPAAERMTRSIEDFTGIDAWKNTDAISFHFRPGNRDHLFDRNRRLVEVSFAPESEVDPSTVVRFQLDSRIGLVLQNGQMLQEPQKSAWIDKAYRAHINDVFWLNPFAALRAPGAVRRLTAEGALLVTFESGGVTPGDSYLIYARQGEPVRWLLWTQAIPARGIEFSFEDWKSFGNGLKISQKRVSFLREIQLDHIQIHEDFPGNQPDPFQELLQRIEEQKSQSAED